MPLTPLVEPATKGPQKDVTTTCHWEVAYEQLKCQNYPASTQETYRVNPNRKQLQKYVVTQFNLIFDTTDFRSVSLCHSDSYWVSLIRMTHMTWMTHSLHDLLPYYINHSM